MSNEVEAVYKMVQELDCNDEFKHKSEGEVLEMLTDSIIKFDDGVKRNALALFPDDEEYVAVLKYVICSYMRGVIVGSNELAKKYGFTIDGITDIELKEPAELKAM